MGRFLLNGGGSVDMLLYWLLCTSAVLVWITIILSGLSSYKSMLSLVLSRLLRAGIPTLVSSNRHFIQFLRTVN